MEKAIMRPGGFPKRYTLGEELVNAITHGLGTLLAAAGGTLMVACLRLALVSTGRRCCSST